MSQATVNPAVLAQTATYAQLFQQAKPFQHVQIDEFLMPDWCQSLAAEFPSFDPQLAINENGQVGGKAVHQDISQLGPAYQQLHHLFQSNEFTSWVSQLTGIPNLLFDPHYFGGGTHENLSGQALDPHVDFTHHPITNHYRRLNLILYLNQRWEPSWGGQIELHQNPRLKPDQDQVVSIAPLFNRMVVFATHHHSWHGFPVINIPEEQPEISRKSIALYYYTKEQPAGFEQPHSTIYVDRHLDPKIQAGTTLSEQQITEIHRLIDSRDQHLQRLYQTISQQMDDLNRVKKLLGPFRRLIRPIKKLLGRK